MEAGQPSLGGRSAPGLEALQGLEGRWATLPWCRLQPLGLSLCLCRTGTPPFTHTCRKSWHPQGQVGDEGGNSIPSRPETSCVGPCSAPVTSPARDHAAQAAQDGLHFMVPGVPVSVSAGLDHGSAGHTPEPRCGNFR